MTANLPRRCYRIAAVCAAFLGTACSDGKEFAIVKERQGNYDLVRAEIVQPFEANGIELKAVLTVTCDLEPEQPRILIAAMGFVKGEDDYEPAPDLDPEFRIGSVLASRGAFSTGYWGTSMRTGLAHIMVFNLSKIFESRKFDLESARGAEERARAALDSATAPIALTKELEARRDSVMEVAFPPGSATRANRSEPLAQLAMALVDSIAWQTRDNTLHLRDPDSWGSEWPTAIEGGNTLNLSLSSDPEWLRPCMATVKTAEETYYYRYDDVQSMRNLRVSGCLEDRVKTRQADVEAAEAERKKGEAALNGLTDIPNVDALAKIGPVWSLQPWVGFDSTFKIEVEVAKLQPVFDHCRKGR